MKRLIKVGIDGRLPASPDEPSARSRKVNSQPINRERPNRRECDPKLLTRIWTIGGYAESGTPFLLRFHEIPIKLNH
jgi:hypothetical protein